MGVVSFRALARNAVTVRWNHRGELNRGSTYKGGTVEGWSSVWASSKRVTVAVRVGHLGGVALAEKAAFGSGSEWRWELHQPHWGPEGKGPWEAQGLCRHSLVRTQGSGFKPQSKSLGAGLESLFWLHFLVPLSGEFQIQSHRISC